MPIHFCSRFNRKPNSPSRMCPECYGLLSYTRNKYVCARHGIVSNPKICDCGGCSRRFESLQRSNRKTRIWNTKGHSKERPNINQYLSHKRQYKKMRDTNGLPRHICPKCNKSASCSEPFRIRPDCGEAFKTKDPYAHCPANAGLAQVQRRACGGFWPSNPYTESLELKEHIENFHSSDNQNLRPEIKASTRDEHKCRYIKHRCASCKFEWETKDRLSSGFGDSDFTWLGTSSIDEGVSNEEFVKRQVRYYHLSGYYKDCHNHEETKVGS